MRYDRSGSACGKSGHPILSWQKAGFNFAQDNRLFRGLDNWLLPGRDNKLFPGRDGRLLPRKKGTMSFLGEKAYLLLGGNYEKLYFRFINENV